MGRGVAFSYYLPSLLYLMHGVKGRCDGTVMERGPEAPRNMWWHNLWHCFVPLSRIKEAGPLPARLAWVWGRT